MKKDKTDLVLSVKIYFIKTKAYLKAHVFMEKGKVECSTGCQHIAATRS